MLTFVKAIRWTALCGLVCLFALVLAHRWRDGNRAIAQETLPMTHVTEKPVPPPAVETPGKTSPVVTGVTAAGAPPIAEPQPAPAASSLPPLPGALPIEAPKAELPPPPPPGVTETKPATKTEEPKKPEAKIPEAKITLPVIGEKKDPNDNPIIIPAVTGPAQATPAPPAPPTPAPPAPPAPPIMPPIEKDPPLATPPAPPSEKVRVADPIPPIRAPAPTEKAQPIPGANIVPLSGAVSVEEKAKPSAVSHPEEPPLAPTPGPTLKLKVVTEGETLRSVARRTLGKDDRWAEVHKLNPNLRPEAAIAPGTVINLPGDACIQEDTEELRPLPTLRARSTTRVRTALPLTGTFPVTLDDQRTILLPRAIMEQLGNCDTVLVSPGSDHCLWLTNQA
ncbi:MAG: hypothetical protein ACKO23_18700, partial [Gemmataceae bacterium]